MPLAIIQAAAYISQRAPHCSVQQFLKSQRGFCRRQFIVAGVVLEGPRDHCADDVVCGGGAQISSIQQCYRVPGFTWNPNPNDILPSTWNEKPPARNLLVMLLQSLLRRRP